MRSRLLCAAACVVALVLIGGCSQADGPLPVARDEVPNRVDDLAKDLLNVARGDHEAPKELSDDLAVFVDRPVPEGWARELGNRTATALRGTRLSDATAHSLANDLWLAVAATELSAHQQQTLQSDAKTQLMSAGATPRNADAVAEAIGFVQQYVTTRTRRWWELR